MSAMTTILGIFLTIYAGINNKTLKEESRNTREIIARIEQGQNQAREHEIEVQKEVVEVRREVVEVRREVAESRKALAEALVDVHREVAESRKALAETLKYIADLIVSESEKTREMTKAQS